MSLDLVAAKNKRDLNGTQRFISMHESLHAEIFALANPAKKFPTLHKISDYYEDSTISYGELDDFKKEILGLVNDLSEKSLAFEIIKFIDLCIQHKENIYAESD
ncbi:hypothetical protein [Acidovorax sp. LjRoot194]|uniref:hypothetical protein n=1 Tax=Acidovorax sp. LjRoot194 TaxID=3342280 RepID=UPI003ECE8593